jgi:3,4-dihydroxy-2-butanone 4-phosphate synthase
MPNSTDFIAIEEALAELKAGRMIVLVDDEQRENEGDFVIAAEFATPEAINFMVRKHRRADDRVHAKVRRPFWHHHRDQRL